VNTEEYLRELGWSEKKIKDYSKSLKLEADLLEARGNRKELWNARKRAKRFLGDT